MVENVLTPPGNKNIDISVIIDIPGANPLAPSGMGQAGFLGDIFEPQPALVVVKHRGGLVSALLKAAAIDKKNVGQPIVVVVEDRDSRPGSLNNELLVARGAGDVDAG